MKALLRLLALIALTAIPAHAHGGVSVSFHAGGFCGGFHGYSGGGFGGARCYYRPYSYAPVYYGGYGYGAYAVSTGYYPLDYGPSVYYGEPDYVYPPPSPTPPPPAPIPSATPQGATNPDTVSTGPIPIGKLDEFGYVHSPFTTTTFKVTTVTDGQLFHDPITGQIFQVHLNKKPPIPPPSGALRNGTIDEFGYIHSPYSTFLFKIQDGNYNRVFRDPNTGDLFSLRTVQISAPSATVTTVD